MIVAVADLVVSATLVAATVTVCCELMLDGAVYSPADEIVPTLGLIDQVTAVLLVPVIVAVNCCVWFADRVAVVGLTDTLMPEPMLRLSKTAVVNAVLLVDTTASPINTFEAMLTVYGLPAAVQVLPSEE